MIATDDNTKTSWHTLSASESLRRLESDLARGLREDQVQDRLATFGPNELTEAGGKSAWRILLSQFAETLVLVLIVAAVVSAALGDFIDAAAIVAIVVLNALLGFRQEYQAERAMAALKALAVPTVKVRRDGHVREVAATQLVPGDLVVLETGNLVPADGRLVEAANVRAAEAALTGESSAVEKSAHEELLPDQSLAERSNMAFRGTTIVYGHGLMVVTATGMQTELGRIAKLIQSAEQAPTPLQKRLAQLGRYLALVALAIVAVIFVAGVVRGEDWRLMFLTAVSLAVAAVPEGLPAVVTIALALGAQRMARRHALIRNLPAVETLGSVTVICSDKTGTLTRNEMTVTVLDVAGERVEVEERIVDGRKRTSASGKRIEELHAHSGLALLIAGSALCCDSALEEREQGSGDFFAVGDPTENALVVAAARLEIYKPQLEAALPRVGEAPFDSDRKRMTTIHRLRSGASEELCLGLRSVLQSAGDGDAGAIAFTKGAIDSVLAVTSFVWNSGEPCLLDEPLRARIQEAHDRLAAEGMRILALAFRPLDLVVGDEIVGEKVECDLIFVGLIGMIDPPRAEAKEAVAKCRSAGIRVVMITGDHPLTALSIARQLGIGDGEPALSGVQLSAMSRAEMEAAARRTSVFARVSPEHKLNLVDCLQKDGHVVAMTGDGVNDAPALKEADIGVAMGQIGTDVAKEAADMVLRDDNFATIVAAVEEGRRIYDNLRKFIRYLLAANCGEVAVMFFGPLFGLPLPLLPLQILWMNLVTDGLPALALGLEPPERNIMRRPPHSSAESIFARGVGRDIFWIGALMAAVALAVGYWAYERDHHAATSARWQTMLFTTLTLSQVFLAMALRSERDSIFTIGLFSNRAMFGAVGFTLVLQLGVIYFAPLQLFLKTQALSATDLMICLGASLLVFAAVELQKLIVRSMTKSVA